MRPPVKPFNMVAGLNAVIGVLLTLQELDGDALAEQLLQEGVRMPGGYTGIASPIKLSRTPASYRLEPPDAD